MVDVHPSALVHPSAQLGEGTRVGPFCIIEKDVVVGKDCTLQNNIVLHSGLRLGDRVQVSPFCVLGGPPQHLKYAGEPTQAIVGDDTVLREYVTIHRGTGLGGGVTRVGSNTYLMAYSHVAHDCLVGDHVITANSVQLAGHVEVGDFVMIGGVSAVTQFCRVGAHCYVGGCSIIRKDLPPFIVGKGNEFETQGINIVGLQRRGMSDADIKALRTLYRIFFMRKLTINQAIETALTQLPDSRPVEEFVRFVKESKVGILR